MWSLPAVLEALRQNIFNNQIWPDLTSIQVNSTPILETCPLTPGKKVWIGGVEVTAHPVDHAVPATGFLIEGEGGAILYTGDTGPTDAIWKAAREAKNLRAIITEISFPDRMEEVALKSKHYTPGLLGLEISKMPPYLPIYLFHTKPRFLEEVHREVEAMGLSRLFWLEQDQTYEFGP